MDIKPLPKVSAKEAGLKYVHDYNPGFSRKRVSKNFTYLDLDEKRITEKETLQRIKSLGIPPAWEKVWICKDVNGHIQATGIDARGRKQYRYHPKWSSTRDETKYGRMIEFSRALPIIRERVKHDLAKQGLPKEKVLATIVQLLEKTLIRVGNDRYAKENNSFGLTTMRNKHVHIEGKEIKFEFKGKSGVMHAVDLEDAKLSKIIQQCHDLPGHELFQFVDHDGNRHSITSFEVNEYLREITGKDFTAKDFRTWSGTVLAATALQEFEKYDSESQAKKNVVKAIESVAKQLGNTKAICRKCYIHPAIINSYLDGSLAKIDRTMNDDLSKLKPEEAIVIAFLHKKLLTA